MVQRTQTETHCAFVVSLLACAHLDTTKIALRCRPLPPDCQNTQGLLLRLRIHLNSIYTWLLKALLNLLSASICFFSCQCNFFPLPSSPTHDFPSPLSHPRAIRPSPTMFWLLWFAQIPSSFSTGSALLDISMDWGRCLTPLGKMTHFLPQTFCFPRSLNSRSI